MTESNKYSRGKVKGGAFEREVATKLSLWFSEGEREDIFYRSHSSGARFTSRKKSDKDTAYQSGDITCSDPIGEPLINKWSVECKTGYGKWDVLDYIEGKVKRFRLSEFWEQACKDAERKEPILIFRRKGKGVCVCIRTEFYMRLLSYFLPDNPLHIIHISSEGVNKLTLMNLEDFLGMIPAKKYISLINQKRL